MEGLTSERKDEPKHFNASANYLLGKERAIS